MIKLTKQQQKIADLLCEYGYGDKQIAYELGLSVPTVKLHLGSIRNSIERQTSRQCSNRVQIVLAILGDKK